jgi:hypothetical protein
MQGNKDQALCQIHWAVKFEFTTNEVNHIDEVCCISIFSCSFVSQGSFMCFHN